MGADPTGHNGPTEPVALRLASGERLDGALTARAHIELYTVAVHSGASGLVEVTGGRRTDGKLRFGKRAVPGGFVAAGDRDAFRERCLSLASEGYEVFTRPATVESPDPTQEAVAGGQVVWVDVDEVANLERLRGFRPRPYLVVFSGGSGGAHAYWRLAEYVTGERLESVNRRLCEALGGDRQSTNRGRLMRVPGTLNRKGDEPKWCRVAMCDLRAPAVELAALEVLDDPKARTATPRPRSWSRSTTEGPLEEMPPPYYFERITGTPVAQDGFVRCPHAHHEDRHPSARVYPNAGEGWVCFSCGAAGNAPDLVSALKGGPTGSELRGDEFLTAKAEALRACGHEDEAVALEERMRRASETRSRKHARPLERSH